MQPLVGLLVVPGIPEAGEGKGAVLANGKGVRLLLLRPEDRPLKKTICGDEAAAATLERFTPGRLCGDGLGFGIEGGKTFEVSGALGEEGNQPSASAAVRARMFRGCW